LAEVDERVYSGVPSGSLAMALGGKRREGRNGMASRLISSERVDGPGGRRVQILFYRDKSIRVRVHDAGPMVISEAYLQKPGGHVIIKVDPATKR